MTRELEIPPGLRAQARLGADWVNWLDSLPRLARDLLEEWELGLDGGSMHGFCSLVLPVRTSDGTPAVLKLHTDADAEESDHEYLALQHWHGDGAVRLIRANPRRRAMLLQRLQPEDLTGLWDLEACQVVADIYRRLHVPAPPQLRPLTRYVGRWTDDLVRLPRNSPVPRRLVEQATALGRAFVEDPASTGTMIHCDLHYENVLASDGGPWLAIDPKPVSGDPHYEVAPMLWNRFDELAGDVRDGVRRRFHTLVDAAELDEDRARDWVVVRMVHNAMWAVEDVGRTGAGFSAGEKDWITRCVTIAKAVQE